MKERLQSSLRLISNRWAMLLLRLALGGLFVVSSLSKLEYPQQFIDSVLSYHMLPEALARPFATILPFAELFIGCSLVLGTFVLFASALTIPLGLSLAIANIYALVRHVGGDTCSCLGSLVTMSHTAALAIDVAMALSAALLATRHRKAGWLGLSYLLRRFNLGLESSRLVLLKFTLVALCLVTAIAFVGVVQKSPVAEQIALNENRIGLIYRYTEDSEAVEPDIDAVSEMRSRFDEVTYLRILATGQDPWADRVFHVDGPPFLFIIASQDDGRPAIRYRFEGPLDPGTVEAVILQVLDEAAGA